MSYIYHYTTLPALISILSNKRLLLTRLDVFNKLYENDDFFPKDMPYDHEIKRTFEDIYVSSWTKNEAESIAIWKMFSNLEDGIRIAINVETAFVCSEEENISIHPLSVFGTEDYFRLKQQVEWLRPVDVIECENCQNEITSILKFKNYEHPSEEILQNIKRKGQIPYLTGDKIASGNEVRLMIKLSSPQTPSNKRAVKGFSSQIDMDSLFDYVLADLPSSFLKDIKIVVSPGFSKTNFIMLNAFLSKFGYPAAVKSNLTTVYRELISYNFALFKYMEI